MVVMNAQPVVSNVSELTHLPSSLPDRMDSAIGEASSVMGSVMTELIRRSLRGGVLQIGEGLHGYACEQVDAVIVEKTPVLENLASEVADRTARYAATEVAKQETEALAREARESDRQPGGAHRTDRRRLARGNGRGGPRLDRQNQGHPEARRRSYPRDGARPDHENRGGGETRRRDDGSDGPRSGDEDRGGGAAPCDTARGELDQRLVELKQSSREVVVALKDRLRVLKETAAELGQRLQEEQTERKAGQSALHGAVEERHAGLARVFQEEQATRRNAEDKLREELLHAVNAANAQLRQEVGELRSVNEVLTARVVELEKPCGLCRLFRRLMFWRRR